MTYTTTLDDSCKSTMEALGVEDSEAIRDFLKSIPHDELATSTIETPMFENIDNTPIPEQLNIQGGTDMLAVLNSTLGI